MMLINITKKLVLVFVIGVLVGAIIATAGFLIFTKTQGQSGDRPTPPAFGQSENSGMPGGPGMNGENGQDDINQHDKSSKSKDGNSGQSGDQGEQPPEKPDGDRPEAAPQAPESN